MNKLVRRLKSWFSVRQDEQLLTLSKEEEMVLKTIVEHRALNFLEIKALGKFEADLSDLTITKILRKLRREKLVKFSCDEDADICEHIITALDKAFKYQYRWT